MTILHDIDRVILETTRLHVAQAVERLLEDDDENHGPPGCYLCFGPIERTRATLCWGCHAWASGYDVASPHDRIAARNAAAKAIGCPTKECCRCIKCWQEHDYWPWWAWGWPGGGDSAIREFAELLDSDIAERGER